MKFSALAFVVGSTMVALASVAACSSSTTPGSDAGTNPTEDAGTEVPDTGTDANTQPTDAGADAPTNCPAYSGKLPGDAGDQCHDLVSNAPSVPVTVDNGTLPTGTGGTLGDGLYYLTEVRIYPGSPVPQNTVLKYAMLVAGDTNYIVDDNGPKTVRRTVKKNPDGGAPVIVCETKADPNPAAATQTATCNSLTTFDSNSKFSAKFVKQ
ncbi:MAG: hypothetical protein U0174_12880 [Polyangiaceae bacterium]